MPLEPERIRLMAAFLSDQQLRDIFGITDEELLAALPGIARPIPNAMMLVEYVEAFERVRLLTARVAPPSPERPIRVSKFGVENIIALVAAYYQILPSHIKGNRRTQRVAIPRQVAMYLARVIDNLSYPELGLAFNRDNSTVQSACQKVREKMRSDESFRRAVEELETMCRTRT